jgi:ketosteroid isomerase-like protein
MPSPDDLHSQSPKMDEIVALDRAWEDAITNRDAGELGRLGSDDLIYTHASSVVEDKGRFIDHIVNGRLRFAKIDYEDIVVRAYGRMALLTCALHLDTVDSSTGTEGELHFRITHVWIREDGRWQLLANQSTYLPSPQ